MTEKHENPIDTLGEGLDSETQRILGMARLHQGLSWASMPLQVSLDCIREAGHSTNIA